MSKHTDELHAEYFYHVFNRTNHREPLFLDDEDRQYFLKKYKQHVSSYVDTYSFCLMGNHFHLVIRVKSITLISGLVQRIEKMERTIAQKAFLEMKEDVRTVHELMSSQFNRMFTAYAMYFNKKHKRSGNLFYRPFKRVAVKSEGHFTWLIYYAHANPRKHKVHADFQNYKWSSYQAFLSDARTMLKRKEVLEWFGGIDGFLKFHDTQPPENPDFDYLVIED